MADSQHQKEALRKLKLVVSLTVVFCSVELLGGYWSHSIAIVSDAAHLASDALGLAISLVAIKVAQRDADRKYTFGYGRAEVLGALASLAFVYAVTGWLVVAATCRFFAPPEIMSDLMLGVSVCCLVFNLV